MESTRTVHPRSTTCSSSFDVSVVMGTYDEAGAVGGRFHGMVRVPDGLTEFFERLDSGFLEREVTPEPAMELGMHFHVEGLALADTV